MGLGQNCSLIPHLSPTACGFHRETRCRITDNPPLAGIPLVYENDGIFWQFVAWFIPHAPKNPPHMASFYQLRGKWRAQVQKAGIRRSRLFDRKGEAQAWAAQVEREIVTGDFVRNSETFGDLLDRYSREVSAGKKGARWEQIRIGMLRRDRLAQVPLSRLDAPYIADWRDRRLQDVSGASVRREINLMSAACTVAVREWKWLAKNPFLVVRKPKDSKARDRIITEAEMARMDAAADTEFQKRVMRAAWFAWETMMREGEIAKLREVSGNVAFLPDTKNGSARHVPLSVRAREIWEAGPFDLTAEQITTTWRKIRTKAGLPDIHFHDLRHTALTRLSKKLDPFELAKMAGIRDMKIMLNVYYKADPAAIAEKLG